MPLAGKRHPRVSSPPEREEGRPAKGVSPTHGVEPTAGGGQPGPSHDDRVHHLIAVDEEPIHPFADVIT